MINIEIDMVTQLIFAIIALILMSFFIIKLHQKITNSENSIDVKETEIEIKKHPEIDKMAKELVAEHLKNGRDQMNDSDIKELLKSGMNKKKKFRFINKVFKK